MQVTSILLTSAISLKKSLFFGDKLHVLGLRNNLKGTKALITNLDGQTIQDTPTFVPASRDYLDQCLATSNPFFKKQALLECRTAEEMLDGLRNRLLNLSSEIVGCLESISNTNNGPGKVRECIDATKTA